jgi:leucyl-tRNA synthetase
VQGMVKGRAFQLKENGKYLQPNEVEIVNEKKNKAIEKSSGKDVNMMWEKMSKSKFNGIDPIDVINTHGCDTVRLIMLGDVAPTSHRNWSEATFPGIINWQKRIWLTLYDFILMREKAHEMQKCEDFDEHESKLLDSANYFVSHATFNFKYAHQLSVAISRMQGLTNSIRRAPADVVALSEQYERALSAQIIMLAPFAPHFASELWCRFVSAPNRIGVTSKYIDWNVDIFHQQWPPVDSNHQVEFNVKVNNSVIHKFKYPCGKMNKLNVDEAISLALGHEHTIKYLKGRKIISSSWHVYPDYEGTLNLNVEPMVNDVSAVDCENDGNSKKKKKKKMKN